MNTNPVLHKPRLLVADDDRLILLTLAEGLADAGFEVLQAQDGLRALEICLTESPDLALLDIRMPKLNGIELASRLKAETAVPFLFFSAFGDEELVKQAVAAGALGYLLKPMEIRAIVPTLRTALATARETSHQKSRQAKFDDALASNRLIALAVGMTMRDMGLPQQEAFEHLRKIARQRRTKLTDIAAALVGRHNPTAKE